MLDKQRGKFIVECDVCGDVLDTEESDFNAARDVMTNNGWKARKFGADWNHSCAGCGVPGERPRLARNGRML